MFQRKALAAAISAASLYGAGCGSAFAEDAATPEVIYITGSYIGRDAFESASPVSVYSAEALAESGATSLDQFLIKQPEFAGYALGTTTNNGNNGVKMVDLRGLGHKRTLVLINGQRQVGSFVGSSLDLGAVDLNTIPMALVERVEVLKDGASTTYGSDAIAGVVNVILRKRFEGIELSGNLGYGTENWDARTQGMALTVGAESDKGGVVLGLEYSDQDSLLQEERKWGEFATWPAYDASTGTFTSTNGASSNSRTIAGLSDAALAQIATVDASEPTRFTVDPTTGVVRAYNGATDSYNYASVNALITPNERWQLSALGDSELFATSMGTVNVHGELQYTKRKSNQQLAPDASFDTTTVNGLDNNFVPASNPFNPFGDTPNNPYGVSGEDVIVRRRFVETGGRLFSQDVDTFRLVAGMDGDLDNGIHWDFSYIYANNDETYETQFYGRFDRWQIMVDPALCAADPKCPAAVGPDGVLNPFSTFGGITQSELAYLMANSLKDNYQTKMTMATFVVDGEFGSLPGGAIGWAVGLDQRSESAQIRPDEFSAGGLTTGGALDPLRGSYNVQEVYGEVRLPLVADKAFVQSFDITASTRYSDYNTSAGSTDTYKVGADWALNDEVRVRAVYSTGFRAPNMVEYFTQAVTFPTSENWCEFTGLRNDISAVAKTNCAALGYPTDYEQGGEWQTTYSQTAAGGDLGPEDSETWTAGVVLTPHFVEGLELSVDWYNIQIDDYIGLPDFNFLAKTCLESVGFSASACQAFDSGRSVLPYLTDGLVDNASTALGNLGTVETSGIDLAARYSRDVEWGPISILSLGFEGGYLDKAEKSFPLTGSYSVKGTAGEGGVAVYPEYRYNATVGVGSEAWNVTWTIRYIDESKDLYRPASITDDAKAEEVYYNDIAASYTYDAYSVILGVDNIADEAPPQFHSGFNFDTAPGYYDSLGRRMFMSVKMSM